MFGFRKAEQVVPTAYKDGLLTFNCTRAYNVGKSVKLKLTLQCGDKLETPTVSVMIADIEVTPEGTFICTGALKEREKRIITLNFLFAVAGLEGADRRQTKRLAATVRILSRELTNFRAVTSNVNRTGAELECDGSIAVGAYANLQFDLETVGFPELTLQSVVMWCKEVEIRKNIKYRVGVAFTEQHPETHAAWGKFYSSLLQNEGASVMLKSLGGSAAEMAPRDLERRDSAKVQNMPAGRRMPPPPTPARQTGEALPPPPPSYDRRVSPAPATGPKKLSLPPTQPPAPAAGGFQAAGQSGFQPPGQSGFQPPGQSGFQPPGQSGFQPPGQSGFQPPGQSGFQPPGQSGFQPPGQSGFQPPGQSGFQPPGQSGFQPPGQSGFQPPGQSSFQPPGQSGSQGLQLGGGQPTGGFQVPGSHPSGGGGFQMPGSQPAGGGFQIPGSQSTGGGFQMPGSQPASGGFQVPGSQPAGGGFQIPGSQPAGGGFQMPASQSSGGGFQMPGSQPSGGGFQMPGSQPSGGSGFQMPGSQPAGGGGFQMPVAQPSGGGGNQAPQRAAPTPPAPSSQPERVQVLGISGPNLTFRCAQNPANVAGASRRVLISVNAGGQTQVLPITVGVLNTEVQADGTCVCWAQLLEDQQKIAVLNQLLG